MFFYKIKDIVQEQYEERQVFNQEELQQEILDKHLKNDPIPESVKRTFHLVHDRRETDRHYKERLYLDNGLWRNIYPDEWDDKEKRIRP